MDVQEKEATPVAADGASENVSERESLLAMLSAPDAIMEPNIVNAVGKFLQLDGTPEEVVKSLANGYRGFAQMCNLVAFWLQLSGMTSPDVQSLVETFMREKAVQLFDPQIANSVVVQGINPPEWIEQLIQHPAGRHLIYLLSERYSDCLLLTYAIQRISDAGYLKEISNVILSTAYMEVYSRVLVDAITSLLRSSEFEFAEKLSGFIRLCNERHGYAIARLQQELVVAVKQYGSIGQLVHFLLRNMTQYPKVLNTLTSVINSKQITSGDILALYQEYTRGKPPPIQFLRNTDFLDVLMTEIFSIDRNKINLQHRDKCIDLATIAACVRDDGLMFMSGEEFETTRNALQRVEQILRRNPHGHELQAIVVDLCDHITYPIVSIGVLCWVRSNLEDSDYFLNNFKAASTPVHFLILEQIAIKFPLQRTIVFDIFKRALEQPHDLPPLMAMELKRNILDRMLLLMALGLIMPVIRYVQQVAREMDEALLSYFVTKLLAMVEPPFSSEFISCVLSLVATPNLQASLRNHDVQSAISGFLKLAGAQESCLREETQKLLHELTR